MFGLFKSKSEIDILQKEYNQAMKKWHKLSSIDRQASDKVYAEAQLISERIEALQSKK